MVTAKARYAQAPKGLAVGVGQCLFVMDLKPSSWRTALQLRNFAAGSLQPTGGGPGTDVMGLCNSVNLDC